MIFINFLIMIENIVATFKKYLFGCAGLHYSTWDLRFSLQHVADFLAELLVWDLSCHMWDLAP